MEEKCPICSKSNSVDACEYLQKPTVDQRSILQKENILQKEVLLWTLHPNKWPQNLARRNESAKFVMVYNKPYFLVKNLKRKEKNKQVQYD